MIFCDYKIFEYFNISDSDVVEDYLIKKVILNIILKPYVNNSKSILDNLISDTKINLNITFKKIFNEKIGQMKNTDKLIYINNYIKDLRQISYPDSLYRSFFVLPELFESSRDGKKHCMDYKKMLVPAFELLRFLELELKNLKELIRLGISEEKEEVAETKIESEDKTIGNEWLKNENGSVIWLKSQDELSRTLFVMLDDENIKNIIIGNSHKFTNNLLFNALCKLNIKIKKNDNLMDIEKNSFLSSFGRSKSDFNNSTKKGGIHYKKENYKAAADELAKLIK